jgi:glycine/D-amino acid oxidase-like deaminating enzyme
MPSYDAVVVGGGLVGSAVALGLADAGLSVAVLDEGDVALRASVGNFGLVWVQGKGEGMPAYARWTRASADRWPAFAERMSGALGLDIGYRRPGGVHVCLSEAEVEERALMLRRMHNQAGPDGYEARMLDRAELADLLPGIGPAVAGGSFCPHDGHVNPLYLLRALRQALAQAGAAYVASSRVGAIDRSGPDYRVCAAGGDVLAGKVVLAAGLGIRELGLQVGLDVPVAPQRGQILVTERAAPWLRLPTTYVRQTEEGTMLLGDSHEDVGFDTGTTVDVARDIAARAVRTFPALAGLQVVRSWGALRVMTPDGFPVYEASRSHPGCFAVACHSGVTLAAAHALDLAPTIADGSLERRFAAFGAGRFRAPAGDGAAA